MQSSIYVRCCTNWIFSDNIPIYATGFSQYKKPVICLAALFLKRLKSITFFVWKNKRFYDGKKFIKSSGRAFSLPLLPYKAVVLFRHCPKWDVVLLVAHNNGPEQMKKRQNLGKVLPMRYLRSNISIFFTFSYINVPGYQALQNVLGW